MVTSDAYTLGCNQGDFDTLHGRKNSLVVLAFGVQTSGGTGTWLIESGSFASNSQIRSYATQFARGYWDCTGSNTTSILRLALGTNNSVQGRVNSTLGGVWASVVNGAKSDTSAYSSQVIIYGAIDAEPKWDAALNAISWASGFDNNTIAFYYNFGTADDCPQTSWGEWPVSEQLAAV